MIFHLLFIDISGNASSSGYTTSFAQKSHSSPSKQTTLILPTLQLGGNLTVFSHLKSSNTFQSSTQESVKKTSNIYNAESVSDDRTRSVEYSQIVSTTALHSTKIVTAPISSASSGDYSLVKLSQTEILKLLSSFHRNASNEIATPSLSTISPDLDATNIIMELNSIGTSRTSGYVKETTKLLPSFTSVIYTRQNKTSIAEISLFSQSNVDPNKRMSTANLSGYLNSESLNRNSSHATSGGSPRVNTTNLLSPSTVDMGINKSSGGSSGFLLLNATDGINSMNFTTASLSSKLNSTSGIILTRSSGWKDTGKIAATIISQNSSVASRSQAGASTDKNISSFVRVNTTFITLQVNTSSSGEHYGSYVPKTSRIKADQASIVLNTSTAKGHLSFSRPVSSLPTNEWAINSSKSFHTIHSTASTRSDMLRKSTIATGYVSTSVSSRHANESSRVNDTAVVYSTSPVPTLTLFSEHIIKNTNTSSLFEGNHTTKLALAKSIRSTISASFNNSIKSTSVSSILEGNHITEMMFSTYILLNASRTKSNLFSYTPVPSHVTNMWTPSLNSSKLSNAMHSTASTTSDVFTKSTIAVGNFSSSVSRHANENPRVNNTAAVYSTSPLPTLTLFSEHIVKNTTTSLLFKGNRTTELAFSKSTRSTTENMISARFKNTTKSASTIRSTSPSYNASTYQKRFTRFSSEEQIPATTSKAILSQFITRNLSSSIVVSNHPSSVLLITVSPELNNITLSPSKTVSTSNGIGVTRVKSNTPFRNESLSNTHVQVNLSRATLSNYFQVSTNSQSEITSALNTTNLSSYTIQSSGDLFAHSNTPFRNKSLRSTRMQVDPSLTILSNYVQMSTKSHSDITDALITTNLVSYTIQSSSDLFANSTTARLLHSPVQTSRLSVPQSTSKINSVSLIPIYTPCYISYMVTVSLGVRQPFVTSVTDMETTSTTEKSSFVPYSWNQSIANSSPLQPTPSTRFLHLNSSNEMPSRSRTQSLSTLPVHSVEPTHRATTMKRNTAVTIRTSHTRTQNFKYSNSSISNVQMSSLVLHRSIVSSNLTPNIQNHTRFLVEHLLSSLVMSTPAQSASLTMLKSINTSQFSITRKSIDSYTNFNVSSTMTIKPVGSISRTFSEDLSSSSISRSLFLSYSVSGKLKQLNASAIETYSTIRGHSLISESKSLSKGIVISYSVIAESFSENETRKDTRTKITPFYTTRSGSTKLKMSLSTSSTQQTRQSYFWTVNSSHLQAPPSFPKPSTFSNYSQIVATSVNAEATLSSKHMSDNGGNQTVTVYIDNHNNTVPLLPLSLSFKLTTFQSLTTAMSTVANMTILETSTKSIRNENLSKQQSTPALSRTPSLVLSNASSSATSTLHDIPTNLTLVPRLLSSKRNMSALSIKLSSTRVLSITSSVAMASGHITDISVVGVKIVSLTATGTISTKRAQLNLTNVIHPTIPSGHITDTSAVGVANVSLAATGTVSTKDVKLNLTSFIEPTVAFNAEHNFKSANTSRENDSTSNSSLIQAISSYITPSFLASSEVGVNPLRRKRRNAINLNVTVTPAIIVSTSVVSSSSRKTLSLRTTVINSSVLHAFIDEKQSVTPTLNLPSSRAASESRLLADEYNSTSMPILTASAKVKDSDKSIVLNHTSSANESAVQKSSVDETYLSSNNFTSIASWATYSINESRSLINVSASGSLSQGIIPKQPNTSVPQVSDGRYLNRSIVPTNTQQQPVIITKSTSTHHSVLISSMSKDESIYINRTITKSTPMSTSLIVGIISNASSIDSSAYNSTFPSISTQEQRQNESLLSSQLTESVVVNSTQKLAKSSLYAKTSTIANTTAVNNTVRTKSIFTTVKTTSSRDKVSSVNVASSSHAHFQNASETISHPPFSLSPALKITVGNQSLNLMVTLVTTQRAFVAAQKLSSYQLEKISDTYNKSVITSNHKQTPSSGATVNLTLPAIRNFSSSQTSVTTTFSHHFVDIKTTALVNLTVSPLLSQSSENFTSLTFKNGTSYVQRNIFPSSTILTQRMRIAPSPFSSFSITGSKMITVTPTLYKGNYSSVGTILAKSRSPNRGQGFTLDTSAKSLGESSVLSSRVLETKSESRSSKQSVGYFTYHVIPTSSLGLCLVSYSTVFVNVSLQSPRTSMHTSQLNATTTLESSSLSSLGKINSTGVSTSTTTARFNGSSTTLLSSTTVVKSSVHRSYVVNKASILSRSQSQNISSATSTMLLRISTSSSLNRTPSLNVSSQLFTMSNPSSSSPRASRTEISALPSETVAITTSWTHSQLVNTKSYIATTNIVAYRSLNKSLTSTVHQATPTLSSVVPQSSVTTTHAPTSSVDENSMLLIVLAIDETINVMTNEFKAKIEEKLKIIYQEGRGVPHNQRRRRSTDSDSRVEVMVLID